MVKKRKPIKLDNTLTRNSIFAPSREAMKKAHVTEPSHHGPMPKISEPRADISAVSSHVHCTTNQNRGCNAPLVQDDGARSAKRKPIKLDNTLTRNSIFAPSREAMKKAHVTEPSHHGPMPKISEPRADISAVSSHVHCTTNQNRGCNAPLVQDDGARSAKKIRKSAGSRRKLATIRRHRGCVRTATGDRNQWTPPEIYSIPTARNRRARNRYQAPFCHKLRRGGTLKVYPNLLSEDELKSLLEEILSSGFFRQYKVQGQDEPRLHYLLNDKATCDEFALQPGYRYARVTTKARPLSQSPLLASLSKKLAAASGIDRWNIGVSPVLYRDSKDGMGGHADNDQGETLILCLVLASPDEARPVVITPNPKESKLQDGDEKIELILRAGDAYVMDGEMQKYYLHSVPKRNRDEEEQDHADKRRISVVFRAGDEVFVKRDSGRPCKNLSAKPRPTQTFGRINELFEGHLYTRSKLFNLNAHRVQQRGISGNRKTGADAIIISGRRKDNFEQDNFRFLEYAAEGRIGAIGLVESYNKRLPIRVFRSSTYRSRYRAIPKSIHKDKRTKYRYDGLYKIVSYTKPVVQKGAFVFELHRSKVGSDPYSNLIRNKEMLDLCPAPGKKNIQASDKTV
ncbi:unnamed protein product [Cylindrotheca closterium]|uniref:Fe2OG dioxygenase domain-containing protein n=1 Tax=Cylindrotheca closterium TaxID=2856 RepID=A0AAD2CE73_9STRA|nr:unnamed protein product [Cylindrotheca closterium]